MALKKFFADELKEHRIATTVAIQVVTKILNDNKIPTKRGLSYTEHTVRNIFYGTYEDLQVENIFKSNIQKMVKATRNKAEEHQLFMNKRKQLTESI